MNFQIILSTIFRVYIRRRVHAAHCENRDFERGEIFKTNLKTRCNFFPCRKQTRDDEIQKFKFSHKR